MNFINLAILDIMGFLCFATISKNVKFTNTKILFFCEFSYINDNFFHHKNVSNSMYCY